MISRRLRKHLESLLQPQQAGFRPHRSTLDPLELLLHKVAQKLKGLKNDAVFVDDVRAFGSVVHSVITRVFKKFDVDPI
jgi:hypothetical protein